MEKNTTRENISLIKNEMVVHKGQKQKIGINSLKKIYFENNKEIDKPQIIRKSNLNRNSLFKKRIYL